MLRKVLVVVCLIAVTALCVSGCKKSTPPPSQPQVQTPEIPKGVEEPAKEDVKKQLEQMEQELKAEEANLAK
jgi:hypothetical protein